ncbi:MAG TPA: hypothetical protein VKG62_06230 [Solirubrobacteraceae bacterium]|nr:hypothetical protein [Solirubrobacteraceae bacterium]
MSDPSNVPRSLRDRLGSNTEDRLGKALSELLENPLLTGAIGRAFDAREKASQAQEVALGALNIPSAADIERLTRRLRSVSNRLEGIEDGVDRLDRALTPGSVEARLAAIEAQLRTLTDKIEQALQGGSAMGGPQASPAAAPQDPGGVRVPPRKAPAGRTRASSRSKAVAAGSKPVAVDRAKQVAAERAKPAATRAKPAATRAKPAATRAKPAGGGAKPASAASEPATGGSGGGRAAGTRGPSGG